MIDFGCLMWRIALLVLVFVVVVDLCLRGLVCV